MRTVALLLLVGLNGCALNKKGPSTTTQDVATAEKLEAAKAEIVTSNNDTANVMAGLVTASVSKVAETVKGVEATMDSVIKINVELTAKLNTQIELNTRLQATIDNLSANLNTQAGLYNKIESRLENIDAGRDVNYLPREAVDVIINANNLCYGIVVAVISLASTITAMSFRASRQRAEIRAKEEREERQAYLDLVKSKP